MIRFGRYSAALLLTGVGILLLLDHYGKADVWRTLGSWWPAAIVALGVELLIVQLANRKENAKVRPAWGALFGAALLGSIVLVAAKGSEFQASWLPEWAKSVSFDYFDSEHAKHSFEKDAIEIPLDSPRDTVSISNPNGRVTLKQGPVANIVLNAVVHVDVEDRTEAEKLAGDSKVQVNRGGKIDIAAEGKSYGIGNVRKPRMDLTITFPSGRAPRVVEVDVGNGGVRIDPLSSETNLRIDLKNGDVTGERIGGDLKVQSVNGDIRLSELSGACELQTVNGDVEIRHPSGSLRASTVHGDIDVEGRAVGGDWKIGGTLGDVRLAWPEDADVQVRAETVLGDVSTDWPLSGGKKEVTGTLGDGTWKIEAETQGDIELKKLGS